MILYAFMCEIHAKLLKELPNNFFIDAMRLLQIVQLT